MYVAFSMSQDKRLLLTELLQAVEVDDVLGRPVVPGADEQVGLLQHKVGLLPLGVQHGLVAQNPHALKLPRQQAVAAERRSGLEHHAVIHR